MNNRSASYNPRGIIFDLDGTLVHTIEDMGDAANTLFTRHGYPEHPLEDFIRWIGNGATKFIEQGIGTVIDPAHLIDYVTEFKEIYAQNLAVKTRLYEGISELLDELAGKKLRCAILSNKPHELTISIAEIYLSGWPLDPVFGQREDVPRKPDPSAALEIAGMMELDPSEILFVGDAAGDVTTAVSAGMIPVGVSWGYGDLDHARKNGHTIIDHPAELISLLEKT
ncbi:MAG: HAD-IA family hydrolase [Bacteroidales bacterium]|nr:HAD-IA family hydrolase [Bacteroidales bacterium]